MIRKAEIEDTNDILTLFINEKLKGSPQEVIQKFLEAGGIFENVYDTNYVRQKIESPNDIVLVKIKDNTIVGALHVALQPQKFSNIQLNDCGKLFFSSTEIKFCEGMDIIVSPEKYKAQSIANELLYKMAQNLSLYTHMVVEVYTIIHQGKHYPNTSSRGLVYKMGGQKLGIIHKPQKVIDYPKAKKTCALDIIATLYSMDIQCIISHTKECNFFPI